MEFEYYTRVQQLLATAFEAEKTAMEQAATLLADTILAGRSIYVFGASHAGILTQELFYRAGGLVVINPIFGREVSVDTSPITHTSQMERLPGYGTLLAKCHPIGTGDVVLVHSVSGRNTVSIDLALAAKKCGATVVALTNLAYSKSVTSRHPCGQNLYQISDLVLDNHGEPGDACVAVAGLDQKVGPTSTVVGAAILNAIVVETVRLLVQRGIDTPPVFYSANLDGGDERNASIFEAYRDSIHYEF